MRASTKRRPRAAGGGRLRRHPGDGVGGPFEHDSRTADVAGGCPAGQPWSPPPSELPVEPAERHAVRPWVFREPGRSDPLAAGTGADAPSGSGSGSAVPANRTSPVTARMSWLPS